MVMSQIKKVESEKKDSDAEDGEGSKEEKKPQRSYSGNFFEERARRQEFSQRRRSKDPDVIYGKKKLSMRSDRLLSAGRFLKWNFEKSEESVRL